jgi:hypothetical protein
MEFRQWIEANQIYLSRVEDFGSELAVYVWIGDKQYQYIVPNTYDVKKYIKLFDKASGKALVQIKSLASMTFRKDGNRWTELNENLMNDITFDKFKSRPNWQDALKRMAAIWQDLGDNVYKNPKYYNMVVKLWDMGFESPSQIFKFLNQED